MPRIDWLTLVTSDAAANLGSLIGGLAAAAAVIIGARGFNKWRRELRGTTNFQVARRVLRALYHLEVQIARTRANWLQFGLEDEAKRATKPEDYLTKWRRDYAERLVSLEKARWNLHLAALEAKIIWKDPAMEALTDAFKAASFLKITADEFFRLDMIRFRSGVERRNEKLEAMHEVLYSTGEGDAYGKGIELAVKKAENWYRVHLR